MKYWSIGVLVDVLTSMKKACAKVLAEKTVRGTPAKSAWGFLRVAKK
jgi:hypothetical protein